MDISNVKDNQLYVNTGKKGVNNQSANKKSSGVENFTTVQYTSKKDGKTYMAKKMTLSQNGKEVTGVFVFDKNAKPDKSGNIPGEFMSYETFMKKMADELPAVNSNQMKAYNPNIKTSSKEERFDKGFKQGVELSDGSILLRPAIEFTGSRQIIPSKEEGMYDVITTSFVGGYRHEPSIRTISEEELYNDRYLSGGAAKKLDDGSYEVEYYKDQVDFNNHEMTTEIMDKDTLIDFMGKRGLYL